MRSQSEVPLVLLGSIQPEAVRACHPQFFHWALGIHTEPGRCQALVLGAPLVECETSSANGETAADGDPYVHAEK